MVPVLRFELSSLGLRGRTSPSKFLRDGVLRFLYSAILDHTESQNDTRRLPRFMSFSIKIKFLIFCLTQSLVGFAMGSCFPEQYRSHKLVALTRYLLFTILHRAAPITNWCLWRDSNPHTPPYLDGAMPRYKLGSLTN